VNTRDNVITHDNGNVYKQLERAWKALRLAEKSPKSDWRSGAVDSRQHRQTSSAEHRYRVAPCDPRVSAP